MVFRNNIRQNLLRPVAVGPFRSGNIQLRHSADLRYTNPAIEAAIDAAWDRLVWLTTQNNGVLYDSKIYRLVSFTVDQGHLELVVGKTTYRELMGTNMSNAHLVDAFGSGFMSNALGLFGLVVSSDQKVILGKRGTRYASLSGKLHLPGGSIDCLKHPLVDADDLFAAYHQELTEELGLSKDRIRSSTCIGLYENMAARSPHLHFVTFSTMDSAAIQRRFESTTDREFSDVVMIEASAGSFLAYIDEYAGAMTFASRGSLLYGVEHIRMAEEVSRDS